MNDKRQIEVFIAGCPVCDDAISLVNRIACPSCEVTTLEMRTSGGVGGAGSLCVGCGPAGGGGGGVADCCQKGINV
mgnify:CR=1 FL=1